MSVLTPTYQRPTTEQRSEMLRMAGEQDRLVRDEERQKITTISRSRTWQLEREGKHPKRRILGVNSVAWLLSDLLWFIHQTTDEVVA